MIQFNLLPDVKLQYIKVRRTQHTVVVVATAAAAGAILVLFLLFSAVNVLQKKHLRDLSGDIQSYSNQLSEVKDLEKILTVQNQLKSLPELHNKKAVASRLFNYLAQVTPTQVSISDFTINFDEQTITFTGDSDSLGTVNKFTDTLKFTVYNTAGGSENSPAFLDVVLASFSRDDTGAHYQVDAKFDPVIFDSASEVTLTVPKIISTRSETEKPAPLFQQSPETGTGQ